MSWKPATIDEVKGILKAHLQGCSPEQIAIFRRYSVEPRFAPIIRYEIPERVVVVAQKSDEVIYWEDVEKGFNVSSVGPDGDVLEHWCNQDDLGIALARLIEPREHRTGNCGPARPLDF